MLYTEDGEDDHQGDGRTLMVDGYTSLHWAVENGDLESVRLLLDNGADINIAASFDKHSGVTALHLASQVFTKPFVRLCFLLLLLFVEVLCYWDAKNFKYNNSHSSSDNV